ncbi:MAG: transketolase [Bdellovibrionaceae bacterium]|nr:transketolase [Pseudobdellovibrionaceae bacterium]
MTQTRLTPLPVRSLLAPTPKTPPRYNVQVQLQSGDALKIADPRATRAMVALMDMNAAHGGAASHYGGPAAFAELMSAVHGLMFFEAQKNRVEWHEAFHFVNDAGHCENGLYALKANYGFADLNIEALKKFRSIESVLTGHGEAHLFPQGVLVSNGPLGSGLPQAQGLAIADALSGRKRITVCALSDGGAMEGEAKESFAAIPGLAKRGKVAPFVLIISDNRTKLSGRIDQDSFSMEPTFQSLEKLGWRVIHLEDGHQLQACVSTLEEVFHQVMIDPTVPVVIHARTIKGKGSKKAEASATGAHGFPLKKAEELPAFLSEIYENQQVPAEFTSWAEELMGYEKKKAEAVAVNAKPSTPSSQPRQEKIQVGVAAALIQARRAGLPVVSVSADLQGSTGVAEFHKEFPDSALDIGIAEANMVSTATGLSISGYIPIVDTFAQFGVTKGALPLTMASLSQGPVIGIFSHTGFQDAADGASHQALSFFAQVSSIPHVETYSLSCSSEAEAMLSQALTKFAEDRRAGRVPPSRIFFLGRENFPQFYREGVTYELGRATVVADTSVEHKTSVTIAAQGSLLSEALKAAAALNAKGIGAIVIHNSPVNHPDMQTLTESLRKTGGRLVTVEEHRLVGGMGELLTHALAMAGEPVRVKSLGVGDHFGQSAYSALDLYKKHGLDATAITAAAQALL